MRARGLARNAAIPHAVVRYESLEKGSSVIVSVVNTKGGVGKTTSSLFIANEFALRGKTVTFVDLDKQGSATSWADKAADRGTPLPFKVEVSNTRRLNRWRESLDGDDVLVIDTPPGDSAIIDAAIDAADFAVIPTQPSAADTERVWETLPSLPKSTSYGVLVTGATLGTKLLTMTLAAFDEEDISRFDTVVRFRQFYRQSVGHRPPRDSTFSDVVNEIVEAL